MSRRNPLAQRVRELNGKIAGAPPGTLITIEDLPSSGKTTVALQCAWHWARECNVGFFTLDASPESLFRLQVAYMLGQRPNEINLLSADEAALGRLSSLLTGAAARNLHLIPAAGMTPADVKAVTMSNGYRIIFVDCIELLKTRSHTVPPAPPGFDAAVALRDMAQSMGVTVVAVSCLRPGSHRNAPKQHSGLVEEA